MTFVCYNSRSKFTFKGKRMNKILIASVLLASAVYADDIKVSDVEATYAAKSVKVDSEKLKQSINFGFANTTGNTETLNLNGKYTLGFTTAGYDNKALSVAFDASAFVTENSGVRDNEEYTATLGLEQDIVNGWLGYASAYWLRNTFRNFDNKILLGAGVGKELLHDDTQSLKFKLGVAYNIEQYSNAQPEHTFTSLTKYVEYNNQLNKTSLLYVKVGASENFDDFGDYEVLTVAGFNFAIAESLSVTLEEEVRYDKIPPVGFDTTDTKTIIRVGYNF